MTKAATASRDQAETRATLGRAQLPADAVDAWIDAGAEVTGDFPRDAAAFSRQWQAGAALAQRLPPKPRRNPAEAAAGEALTRADRAARDRFLAAHADTVYRRLTKDFSDFVRAEPLVYAAAALVPGLVPTRATVAAERELMQADKPGAEIDQGIFLSRILADRAAGAHLCHAMLLPRADSLERLPELVRTGAVALPSATVERRGKAAQVTMRNRRFLNAEDESTFDDLEIAIDLALLDSATEIAVLRGDTVDHPKYRGRRLFSAGINLTHLYYGKIRYLWYVTREMGLVNKMFRGLAKPDASPDEVCGDTIEKPWIAAVDGFAIGGGCQILLVTDYVLAASDAYMTLPARKEGIIPGASNLRLPRFTGDRIARQAILYGRRLECDSDAGRLICDEIAAPEDMDAALDRVIEGFTSSGLVSAAGNRRAFRVGEEPLDVFRAYMAVYAREQAYCHFSPALIANLERHWNAQQRRA
ncbi:MAG TPA: enoyl-CoA hydratase/isomerase family protein [Stellaceae bacterium]|nr:enoyl-CoA hydratase/isomerase family protein [Stellaceae bacterium]